MVRELLEETRQASLDEPGRKRLADIYSARSGADRRRSPAICARSSTALAPPVGKVPTESEIRVAQAQLVGWLEGLFHGIQAAMFAQQAAARAQFEELRRRGLVAQNPQPGDEVPPRAPAAASTSSRLPAPFPERRLLPARASIAPLAPRERLRDVHGTIDSSSTTIATTLTIGRFVGRGGCRRSTSAAWTSCPAR